MWHGIVLMYASLYIYVCISRRYDRLCSFSTVITLDLIINALICVTDQTREAVLHCGSGGGLAGECFFIFIYTCKLSIRCVSRYRSSIECV